MTYHCISILYHAQEYVAQSMRCQCDGKLECETVECITFFLLSITHYKRLSR